MDKKKLELLKRHDLLIISTAGRLAIFQSLKNSLQPNELELAEFIFCTEHNGCCIPAIVRRAEAYSGSDVPCGFVYPYLIENRRWRLAEFVQPTQIIKVLTPYEVFTMPKPSRSKSLRVLQQIQELAVSMELTVGVLGSLALEIYTNLAYTHNNSDIDLIVKHVELDELKVFFAAIVSLARQQQVKIDLEVELTNGYGIKAQELFMDTRTILAKGKQDVVLLTRSDVLRALK